jgi:hypothetical protein
MQFPLRRRSRELLVLLRFDSIFLLGIVNGFLKRNWVLLWLVPKKISIRG